MANLFRPQNQTLLFVVSLGLGVCLLTLTVLARAQVLRQIAVTESGTGPNLYLVDVQPDQADDLRGLLAERLLPVVESAPMVNMRLVSVKGTEVRQLRDEGRVPAWVLRREFRSSYRTTFNATEREIAGQWPPAPWQPDDPIPLSLETGMAADLNVGLGDRLVVDIQGRTLEAKIVHLREVDWSRLNLNFFMLFPPGVLEDAPAFTSSPPACRRTPPPDASKPPSRRNSPTSPPSISPSFSKPCVSSSAASARPCKCSPHSPSWPVFSS